jgi:ADP-heptose:LPS heptosyltransferase
MNVPATNETAEVIIGARKAAKLQRLDGILGPPLCVILSAFRFVNAPIPEGRSPKSLAFIKLGEQGSTVLAIPALEEAVSRVGRENTFFVVFSENRKILDVLGVIPEGNVLEIKTSSVFAFLKSVISVSLFLRKLGLDAAIDLDFFARSSALLTFLSGAKWRVGLHSYFGEGPFRGWLMTHRPRYNPHIHSQKLFYSLVKALDQPPSLFPAWKDAGPLPPPRQITIQPGALESIKTKLLANLGGSELPRIVLLNANCSDMIPLRRWESERFVELARRILTVHPGVAVVFTGAPVEAAQAGELAESVGSPRCFSMAGKTTLTELFALYSLAEVLVTNDSGPAHFASLTTIRIIALFGPETPALFGPVSPGSLAITAGLPCSPCVSAQNNRLSACKNNLCMQAITIDRVFAEVDRILVG